MASPPLTADDIRTIIREEMEPFEKRINQRFDAVDERFDAVDEDIAGVKRDIAELKTALIGVIDERFPPVDQQPRSGGPSDAIAMAAKSPTSG